MSCLIYSVATSTSAGSLVLTAQAEDVSPPTIVVMQLPTRKVAAHLIVNQQPYVPDGKRYLVLAPYLE